MRAVAVLVCALAAACGDGAASDPAQLQTEPVVSGARGPVRTLGRPAAEVRTLAVDTHGDLVVAAWSSGAAHDVEVAISRDGGRRFDPPRRLAPAVVPGGPAAAISVRIAPWAGGVLLPWRRDPLIEVRLGSSSGGQVWRSRDGDRFDAPEPAPRLVAGGWTSVDTVEPGRVRVVPPVDAGTTLASGAYLPSQVVRRPSALARFLTAGLEPTGMVFGVWHEPSRGGLSVHRYVPEGAGHEHGGVTGEFDIPFILARDVPSGTRAAAAARGAGAFVAWIDADDLGPVIVGRQVVFDQWCVPSADLPPAAQAALNPGER